MKKSITASPEKDQNINKLQQRVRKLERETETLHKLLAKTRGSDDKSERFSIIDQTETILKLITTTLTSIAAAASMLYIIGLIIVNMHLSSFGVRVFSLARIL